MDWKNFIDTNLLTPNGFLKRFIRDKQKFAYRFSDIYVLIFQESSFLPEDATIDERLYCLYNNIKPEICSVCKTKNVKFYLFNHGYRTTCSAECYKQFVHLVGEDGLSLIQRRVIHTAQTMANTFVDGKSLHQLKGIKGREKTKKEMSKLGEDGLTGYQRSAKKTKITKSTIDENGLTISRKAGLKSVQTKKEKIGEDGLSVFESSAIKGGKTRAKKRENGTSIAKEASIKANVTRSKIGPDGLDAYQRGMIKCKKEGFAIRRYNENLIYQGSYERYFLDQLKNLDLLDKIKNGAFLKFKFFDVEKLYRPDFVFNNIIFEIKSFWTYDHYDNYDGKSLEIRQLNHFKWLSCLEQNYRVIVIIEKNFYIDLKKTDFIDISQSLLFKKQPLTNEILFNCFK